FHIVTPVSTPANMVAVPLCALVLVCNMASLLLACWWSAAAEIFNHAGWALMECIRVSSHWFARLPNAYHYVREPSLLFMVTYYLALISLATRWLLQPRHRGLRLGGAGALVLACAAQWLIAQSVPRLSIVNVQGGDLIYFDASGRKSDLLIDGSNTNAVESVT